MTEEHKVIMQQTIDRLLYCGEDYARRLEKFNAKFDPHKKVTYTTDPKQFKFPLEHAI